MPASVVAHVRNDGKSFWLGLGRSGPSLRPRLPAGALRLVGLLVLRSTAEDWHGKRSHRACWWLAAQARSKVGRLSFGSRGSYGGGARRCWRSVMRVRLSGALPLEQEDAGRSSARGTMTLTSVRRISVSRTQPAVPANRSRG